MDLLTYFRDIVQKIKNEFICRIQPYISLFTWHVFFYANSTLKLCIKCAQVNFWNPSESWNLPNLQDCVKLHDCIFHNFQIDILTNKQKMDAHGKNLIYGIIKVILTDTNDFHSDTMLPIDFCLIRYLKYKIHVKILISMQSPAMTQELIGS